MGANATALSAELFDNEIVGFSIDSRTTGAGELFFALSQEDYARAGFNGTFADAHRFIPQAFKSGAIAAVARADRVRDDAELQAMSDRLLLVEDAIAALQTLAHKVYEAWARPVVGITGSAGKTTAKELTAHLLRAAGRRVLKSERNYNNGLGLPLAVLQMVTEGRAPDEFDIAVLEMGMSSPTHEIERLCKITPPDVGVELLVAPVHLEHLGTIENIAAAKAELIEGMKPNGTAILNADDKFVIAMRAKHDGPVITFGIEHASDVMATNIDTRRFGRSRFRLKTPLGEADAELPMPGRHNLMNALAAAAVANCFEIKPEEIARAGIDLLWGVRGLAQEIIEGAREAGMSNDATRFFETSEQAAAAIVNEIREGDLVLVKGSRGVQTDKVVSSLREHFPVLGADESQTMNAE